MSSAPTADEIARDARWLAQALDPAAGHGPADRDGPRQLSRRELPRRPACCSSRSTRSSCPGRDDRGRRSRRTAHRRALDLPHRPCRLDARLAAARRARRSSRDPRAAPAARPRAQPAGGPRSATSRPSRSSCRAPSADSEFACVKATSFVSEIAPELVPRGRARAVHVRNARAIISPASSPARTA